LKIYSLIGVARQPAAIAGPAPEADSGHSM
jgi:hypothetical protein